MIKILKVRSIILEKLIAQVRTEKISGENFYGTNFDIFHDQIKNQIRNQIIFGRYK